MIGGAGVDTVLGGEGDDRLDAEAADGGAGNDTLSGGVTGQMTAGLQGGTGSDTYDLRQLASGAAMVFEMVDGSATTATDVDTLLLPAHVSLGTLRTSLYASRDLVGADDIALNGDGHGGSVYLRNALRPDGSTAGVERVVLGDGQVLSLADLRRLVQGQITEGRDGWDGTSGADSIDMLAGNDWVDGRGGNDTLIGGQGDDTLVGGEGDDRFVMRTGSGFDVIQDAVGTDVVKLADANSDQVGLYRQGDDLWIYRRDDLRAQVRVKGHFGSGWNGTGAIERIEFADGSTWAAAEFATHLEATAPDHLNLSFEDSYGDSSPDSQLIKGNSGNNRLVSCYGADTLEGGAGDDFYDIDTRTILTTNTYRRSDDTVIELANGGNDTLQFRHWEARLPDQVENLIHVHTGAYAIDGNGNFIPVELIGNALANHLSVKGNPDFGPAYWFDGGEGADTMVGGQGNDTYVVDNIGDVVVDSGKGGVDTVRSSVSYSLGASIENLQLIGVGAKRGDGNDLANVITAQGNPGASDTLVGGRATTYTRLMLPTKSSRWRVAVSIR